MGIVDDELSQLKNVVANLESRIKRLEQRGTGSSPTTEELRMILIGPPGAGSPSPSPPGLVVNFFFSPPAMLTCLLP